jgi:hypothetical protein
MTLGHAIQIQFGVVVGDKSGRSITERLET